MNGKGKQYNGKGSREFDSRNSGNMRGRSQNEKKGNPSKSAGSHGRRNPFNGRDYDPSNSNCVEGVTNDPAWYTNRGATGLSGSYPFNVVTGLDYDLASSQVSVLGAPDAEYITGRTPFRSPGIMVLRLAPTFGSNVGTNVQATPINVAANKVYSFIRHANSGGRNYQKSDVVIYLTAVAEAYSFYGWMTRLYAVLNKFSTFNRYWGASLIKAMGGNPIDLWKFQTNFKTYINQYAQRLNVLKIPANWPYFLRKYMLYSNVYVDEESDKAQLILFNPRCFLKYNTNVNSFNHKYGTLITKTLPVSNDGNQTMTFDNIRDFGNDMIDNIILDSDFALISGDVEKAYGSVFNLPYMAEDYVLPFVYDKGINMQINNALIWNAYYSHSDGNVVLDQIFDANGNDALQSTFVIDLSQTAYNTQIPVYYSILSQKQILNVHAPNISEGEMLEATRLMAMPSSVSANDDIGGVTGKYEITAAFQYTGTEILDSMVLIHGVGSSVGSPMPSFTIGSISYTGTLSLLTALAQFHVKPMIYVATSATSPTATTTGHADLRPLTLLDNYVFMDVHDLERLHTAALLSLFDVTAVSSVK